MGIDLSTLFGERNFVSNGIESSCEKVRSNLRINLIVLKKKDKQEKEVEIPLETKKIELSLS